MERKLFYSAAFLVVFAVVGLSVVSSELWRVKREKYQTRDMLVGLCTALRVLSDTSAYGEEGQNILFVKTFPEVQKKSIWIEWRMKGKQPFALIVDSTGATRVAKIFPFSPFVKVEKIIPPHYDQPWSTFLD